MGRWDARWAREIGPKAQFGKRSMDNASAF